MPSWDLRRSTAPSHSPRAARSSPSRAPARPARSVARRPAAGARSSKVSWKTFDRGGPASRAIRPSAGSAGSCTAPPGRRKLDGLDHVGDLRAVDRRDRLAGRPASCRRAEPVEVPPGEVGARLLERVGMVREVARWTLVDRHRPIVDVRRFEQPDRPDRLTVVLAAVCQQREAMIGHAGIRVDATPITGATEVLVYRTPCPGRRSRWDSTYRESRRRRRARPRRSATDTTGRSPQAC